DALEVCGTLIDVQKIDTEIFCVAGTSDHITPWQACYKSARLFGEHCEFVLSNSGHIQSILNPPGNPKASYLHGLPLEENPEVWQANASKQRDSWWLHWRDWQQARSGELKKAPRRLGNKTHAPAEAAPGTYVHERSTRLNSSHVKISYAVFCLKKKNTGGLHAVSISAGNALSW